MKSTESILAELKNKQQEMLEYLQKHWGLFLAEGIFFTLLGMAAIVIPQVISVVIVIFLGWIIVLAGAMHMSRALFFRDMPGFGLWLGLGVLQIAVGYLLIADPLAGVVTLTMMMTLFFALEGILKIYLAFKMRPLPQWYGVLFSGITGFFFAAIILAFWSESEHWLLGLFLGINMIILGGSMVIVSLRHKDSH
jgi:uncharacterized membrane protein HdeD (DUF308 family)